MWLQEELEEVITKLEDSDRITGVTMRSKNKFRQLGPNRLREILNSNCTEENTKY